ncbi:uroporphyrinogen-III synthase [Brevundimonas pondensis]|uniref:Uroporphyrinogen-III synthase n=1 Tax=Brevundimonas pondensis TaxID=2774189 RepID=A0ABX7SMS1_9CAUL|nr:uroporphyrinogen-III synthase [Brevundimonas pondensis]QTC87630.1 uroporphyrinogen-III synthase [Brevundimonas pondensis]
MRPIRRVWITRAQPGAARTAARLTARGFTPVVVPLLTIRPLPDALKTAPDFATVNALAFTSPNGVEAFAALTPALRDRPVFAVGDATAEAARDAGFANARSAAGDIHALARLIAATSIKGLILAPGAREPAGDLPALLPACQIQRLPVYAAEETGAVPPADFDAVLLHSPRAARALAACLDPDAARNRLVVCISPAAAVPLQGLSFTEIRTADAPDENSMLTALGKSAGPV